MTTKMLALVSLAALSGCAFKYAPGEDWLPLVGQPRTTDDLPGAPISGDLYLGGDGRLWVVGPENMDRAFSLISYENPSQVLPLPALTQLTNDGLMTIAPSDNQIHQSYHVELSTPGQPPRVMVDIDLSQPEPFIEIYRGPGYFVVVDSAPLAEDSSVILLHDDGSRDSFLRGAQSWDPLIPTVKGYLTMGFQPAASERYLILTGFDRSTQTELAGVYDLQQRQLRTLGELPNSSGIDQLPSLIYDQPRERLWAAGTITSVSDLTTGEVTSLPFATIDLRLNADGGALLQDDHGNIYSVDSNLTRTFVGNFEPNGIKASSGARFVYTKPGFDDFDHQGYGGFIGDRQVIRSGLAAAFSADGKKLRWLEDAANDQEVGDLYSMDVDTFAVRRLVRNVKQFVELRDGRLVAIADAAVTGAWNRAVLVDEDKSATSWLVRGVQKLQVLEDKVVATRVVGSVNPSFLLAIPPR